jgi:NitT/TauT family transport system permease protein
MLRSHAASLTTATPKTKVSEGTVKRTILRTIVRCGPAILAALVVFLSWQAIVVVLHIPVVVLPPPTKVIETIHRVFPLLLKHSVPTGIEATFGFVLSAIGGIALAIALASSKLIRDALYPNILLFQLIPKIALAPLFIVWFGIGSTSRLAFIVFISFFPIVLSSLAGLLSTPPEMMRLCRACSARSIDVFIHVRFPYAVPLIFSGLKISVTFAIIGVVVGEFISAQAGLGYLILFASSQADTPLALAAITFLCLLGLLLYGVVVGIESLVLRSLGERRP